MSALTGLHAIGIGCVEYGKEPWPTLAIRGLLGQVPRTVGGAEPQRLGATEQQAGADTGPFEHIVRAELPGRRRIMDGQGRHVPPGLAPQIGKVSLRRLHDAQGGPPGMLRAVQHRLGSTTEGVARDKVATILRERAEAADEVIELLVDGAGGLAQIVAQGGGKHVGSSFARLVLPQT